MYNLQELTKLKLEEQIELGTQYTVKEILQQPKTWKDTFSIIEKNKESISSFLTKCGVYNLDEELNIYITGAGTSEFVGNAIAPFLQKSWNRPVISVGSTEFITQPEYYLLKNKKNLVFSLGRSGSSPESIATYNKTKEYDPTAFQINICCNKDSKMLSLSKNDENTLDIILPDETNDVSLVMTSSYSNMVLALLSLTYLENINKLKEIVDQAGKGAEEIFSKADLIQEFITKETSRILYLGTAEIKGCAQECRLKSQEMTDGKILSDFNSYLGLRHGPQVFANKTSLIVAFLSSDSTRRKYEIDLLKEMQAKEQGADYLLVCDQKSDNLSVINGKILEVYPEDNIENDAQNILTFVVVGQLCGLFKSIQIGHKPDAPSSSGTINRVVSGVEIY